MEAHEKKEKELAGRVALITGSSKGIGKAIAHEFARRGADVILCGRTLFELENASREIGKFGRKVHFGVLDATKPKDVEIFFNDIVEPIGSLDILVNNIGGVRQFAKFEDITDEAWKEIFEVNLMTMVNCTRIAIPLLSHSKNARIINISSVAGKQPGNWNPHYGALKAAEIHLSKSLARHLGPKHILVNTICPSTIKGEGVWMRDVFDKARRENISKEESEILMSTDVKEKSSIGEMGTPEDVAHLAAFLASSDAKFITGTCIQVDGGTIRSMF